MFQHTKEEIRHLQERDEDLGEVRKWLEQATEPDRLKRKALSPVGRLYAGLYSQLALDRGLIRYNVLDQTTGLRRSLLCLPYTLWEDTMTLAHTIGGHMAADSTLQRLRRSVYFPTMKKEVHDFVAACATCQAKQGRQKDQRHTLVSPTVGYPFQRLHVCLLYTSPSPRDRTRSRMPSSA